MTKSEIKAEVKARANLSSPEADVRIGNAIDRHHSRITASLGMGNTREVTRTAVMTVGVATVTFSNIEKITRVFDVTSGKRLIDEKSLHVVRSQSVGGGAPSMWTVQTSSANTVTILTDTQPQTVFNLQADGTATLAVLGENDEPAFPASYHDILTWNALAEELLRKEKIDLAREYASGDPDNPGRAERLEAALRFQFADTHTQDLVQNSGRAPMGSGSSSTGGSSTGTNAYTQSALVTFDLGAGQAPFAVTQADAATVANLDADKLDGEDGSYYRDPLNLTPITSGYILGRDASGAGAVEQIQVGTGLQLTGTGILQRGELLGDVTASAGSLTTAISTGAVTTPKILAGAVTLAKMADLGAAQLIGRGSASGTGVPEPITIGTGLEMAGTVLKAADIATQAANTVYAGPTSGTVQQPAFRSLVAADLPVEAVRVLDRNVTLTTINNSSAEQTVYSFTVPANAMSTTRGLRLTGIMDSSALGAGSTVNVRLNFGGTTIHSGTISIVTSSIRNLQLIWTLQNITASSQLSQALIQMATHAGAAAWVAGASQQAYGTSAIDTTADRALAVTLQLNTNSVNFTINARSFMLELV